MIKRINIYIKEMFPLKVYVPFAFLNHYVLFFAVQKSIGAPILKLSAYSLIGVCTILGFMLIMRVFDELKDEEVDKKLFAHRPYPRGDVKKEDIVILAIVTFVIVCLLNLLRDYTLPFFLICVFYGFLTYKWFFFKRQISKNLILALVTHQPLTFLVNVYVSTTAMVQAGIIQWNMLVLFCCFVFFLPVLAWEISRKIKAEGTENAYVTYSKLLGPQVAAGLNLAILIGFMSSVIYLGIKFNVSIWHHLTQVLLLGFTIFIFVRFIKKPIDKHLVLKKATEILPAISSVIFLIGIMLAHGVHISWF
jgi:4-hydroxybenzoate polyprenyltransferase